MVECGNVLTLFPLSLGGICPFQCEILPKSTSQEQFWCGLTFAGLSRREKAGLDLTILGSFCIKMDRLLWRLAGIWVLAGVGPAD